MCDGSGYSISVSTVTAPVDREISTMCARLHIQEIPNGFLPTFGVGVLSHLYQHIAESDKSFLIVASRGGKVCGFICGTYGTGSILKSFVFRKLLWIAVPVAIRLLKPGVLKRTVETIKFPVGEAAGEWPGSEILNFCVSRNHQGEGIGKLLFQASCDEFDRKDVSRISIVTGEDQISARRFYVSAGAVKVGDINVHGSICSQVYIYTIKESEAKHAPSTVL
jgi:ribosomal protein S18 acetylase RimI-like enzyme